MIPNIGTNTNKMSGYHREEDSALYHKKESGQSPSRINAVTILTCFWLKPLRKGQGSLSRFLIGTTKPPVASTSSAAGESIEWKFKNVKAVSCVYGHRTDTMTLTDSFQDFSLDSFMERAGSQTASAKAARIPSEPSVCQNLCG